MATKKNSKIQKLLEEYKKRKKEIDQRIKEFEANKNCEEKIARELIFCICAANSSAKAAARAEEKVGEVFKKTKKINYKNIAQILKECKVRFHNKKAVYCIKALDDLIIRKRIFEYIKKFSDRTELRNYLAKNISGLGMKESSHFLRNIAIAKNLAILDRHILKSLKYYGVIKQIPKTLTKKQYLAIEQKMLAFCKKIKIEPAKLDLLFWSEHTGHIFK
ncbi:MAG: N-glycosylase/DNA lyase [Candidatus Micrarchaeota archaeon]|nr:N-glycosylase/DNA lyase [Candidatus Micrarchaeota archaeon]